MPYGTVNADVIGTSVANTSLGAGNASIMKNRIINGAMVIDQRGTASTPVSNSSAAALYTVDRFVIYGNQSSKFTAQQSTLAPAGFTNSLKLTSSSAYTPAAGETFTCAQFIEGFNVADLGWGTANAKTVTVSFQVYSSLTGTFGGALLNGSGNRAYLYSYSIPVANTWTTISITIPGDTTGTWFTNNSAGLSVYWSLGAGNTYSGTANTWLAGLYVQPTGSTALVSTNGATLYITGVQLEVGSSATGFEYRMYQQELALCQRYAFVTDGSAGTAGGVSNSASGYAQQRFPHPIPMRSAPAIAVNTAGSWVLSNDFSADYTAASVGIISYNSSTQFSRVQLSGFSGLPTSGNFVGAVSSGGTGKLIFSAEL